MALIVGIREGYENFTEEENELIRSFEMGTIAMAAGVGTIDNPNRGHRISVEEATDRFNMVLDNFGFTTIPKFEQEFVQRLADNDWSCNVSNETTAWFVFRLAHSSIMGDAPSSIKDNLDYDFFPKSYSMIRDYKKLVGRLLNPSWEEYHNAEFVDGFEFPNSWYEGEFFDGKYLAWDMNNDRYYLADEEQEEY
jgi:hypothetical protein